MSSLKVTRKKRKRTVGETAFSIINYTIFAIFTLICIYPFYYLFINSISANDLSANGSILFYPQNIQFTNYVQVLQLPGFGQAVFISVARTVLGTILPVVASAFLGFLFSSKEMLGRKIAYRFVVITMYFSAGMIPWYLTMMQLGLLNNFLAYVIPYIVQPFNIILVKTYIESTPMALQEAAKVDGAGTLTIFWKIVIPLITPILATVAIFGAVGQWNQFMDTVLLMTDSKLYTLQFILYRYLNESASLAKLMQGNQSATALAASMATKQTPTSIRMTVTVVVTLPILFVYPFFQRYFVQGIMIGAVKG